MSGCQMSRRGFVGGVAGAAVVSGMAVREVLGPTTASRWERSGWGAWGPVT